jgi:hypothetical protein
MFGEAHFSGYVNMQNFTYIQNCICVLDVMTIDGLKTINYEDESLLQGWANFFVGGPNEKSKISGGPTYFIIKLHC